MTKRNRTVRGVEAPPPRLAAWVPTALAAILSVAYLVAVGLLPAGL